MSTERQELETLAKQVVGLAEKAGADAAEVIVREGRELTAKVRQGKPEVVQEAGSRALGLRLFADKREALTYTSDMRAAALENFVAETVELAKLSEPDELHYLPADDEYAREFPALDLYDESYAKIDAEKAIELGIRGEKAALAHDKRVTNSDGATFSRVMGSVAFANSADFCGSYAGTYGSFYVEPVCDDEGDKKRNGYWWTADRFYEKLESPEAVGEEAARRTVAQLGAQKVPTQSAPIVFDPEAGRAIVGMVAQVANGSAFYRQSTYLLERENTQIAGDGVTIIDDPLRPRAPGSKPFDGEGLATRKNTIVDAGVLKTVICDSYTARKLGRKSTGSASRGVGSGPGPSTTNLYLVAGDKSREEILKQTGTGLYVTSMMGFGFNPVTGDFSRGASGFWIENGELTFPVSEITISSNFNDLLMNIDMLGNDLAFRTSTACPTFRVSSMTIAGN